MVFKLSRIPVLTSLTGALVLFAGCGSDEPETECEVNCPCNSVVDCPDPLNQVCDENFTCQPRDGGDTGVDTDAGIDVEDTGADVEPDATPDGGEDAADVPEDTPQDTPQDTPEDTPEDGDTPDVPDGDIPPTDVPTPDADATPDAEGDVIEPPPSVANPWVVFTAPDESFLPKIYMVRATGADLTQIDTGDIVQYDPTLSPDGTILAFRTIGAGVPLLKTVNLLTGEVSEIDHGLASMGSLGWSWDGAQVICEGRLGSEGNNDIFRIPLDGSGAVAIGTTAQPEAAPIWFSENRVYFVTDADTGIFEVWRRAVDTLTDEQVTFGGLVIGGAQVSWDEMTIAYVMRTGADSGQLFLQDLFLGTLVPVGSSSASGPFLTADGNMLGYIDLVGGGNREVVLADMTGVTLNVVTDSAAPEADLEIGRVESGDVPLWLAE